jgi:4-alpha-glucanotransferase
VSERHAGVSVPLFSARSTSGWGIGEIADLVPLSAWLAEAGCDRVMLLPLGTIRTGETSPYAAASTVSIDPVYIAMDSVIDFEHAGGAERLSPTARDALATARASRAVQYEAVRCAKAEALALAFDEFLRDEWEQFGTRAARMAAFVARERWWLDDYALFQAISAARGGVPWRDWPAPLAERDPRALDEARRLLARDVLRHQYMQWIADEQWQAARGAARERGVAVFGDLPFVASTDSADVWSRSGEFLLDVSAGVPPDAFSETGQDWGLPTYRWDAIAESDYAWIRQRARRLATLFDGIRVDHVIGLFRTYGRPPNGEPFFTPPDEASQRQQGERVLRLIAGSGVEVIAEDLGLVPDFLRASLERLAIPGCKVIRWERDWHAPDKPFFDPAQYPARSATMTGTHDTETVASWWDELPIEDRSALLALPLLADRGLAAGAPWSSRLRDALLELAYSAGSVDLFVPVQDVFGWRDRINTPGTIGPGNWTWCLPVPVDRLQAHPEALERAAFLRRLAGATARGRPRLD